MTREEAINILRETHNNALFSVRTALETLAPELNESEDERIRKAIRVILIATEDEQKDFYSTHGLTRKDCTDWLEKQKEVGIRWFESDNIKNPDKPYIDKVGMFYTTDGRMCHASDIEKQKDILSERATNITANMLEDGIEGIQRELIEFLSNTINAPWVDIIKSADAYAQRIRSMIEKQKEYKKENLRDFIDNFPYSDKQEEQKPMEKQDYSGLTDLERAIHRGFLCAGVENVPVVIIKETAQDCIASLSPSWKPNEEQIATLRRALHINPASGKLHELKENEVCILQSLLRELEKL